MVALALNTAVLGVDIAAGIASGSSSLVMDAVHNLSDETALALLATAYTLRRGLSGRLLGSANFFNSVGLLAISAVLVARTIERFTAPVEVVAAGPLLAGLLGVFGNWGVAAALRAAAREDPAIRLAYVHNLGDVLLSFAPVVAGALILVTDRPLLDPVVALLIAAVIVATTLRELVKSGEKLLWPPDLVCGHEASAPVAASANEG